MRGLGFGEPILRRKDQLGNLPNRTRAAFATRNVVRMTAHAVRCVRHADGETAGREQRHVRQVVADVRASLDRDAERRTQAFPRRDLVRGTEHHVRHAQVHRAMPHRRCVAAGDPGDLDACALQHLDALAVEREVGLELASVVVDVDAAVGQHAVDVERQQADAPGTLGDVGGL